MIEPDINTDFSEKPINIEGALKLLEAMCADSATEFEKGVRMYHEAAKLQQKGKKQLNEAIKILVETEGRKTARFGTAFKTLQEAYQTKYKAMALVKFEYRFLSGQACVDPFVNGDYVMSRLICEMNEQWDTALYEDICAMRLWEADPLPEMEEAAESTESTESTEITSTEATEVTSTDDAEPETEEALPGTKRKRGRPKGPKDTPGVKRRRRKETES